jgi:hypothetical protein
MKNSSRRSFLRISTAAAAATLAAPHLILKSKAAEQIILGSGEHRYEVIHNWPQLPDKYTWQTTHDVAVDKDGLVYIIHEGKEQLKDHPAIFVFDRDGKFVRAFGSQFQGGGHGLEVITEGSDQFLYVTGYQKLKKFAKLTLTGAPIWEKHAPMESGVYAEGEDHPPKAGGGRDRFQPTNFAFRPDGGFFLADGYGAYRIHSYDKSGGWLSTLGKPGKGDGEFNLPHGLCIDARTGREPMLAVADRINARLQWFTLDGKHIKTLPGFILPANLDTWKDLMLVPDLSARVSLLDGKDNIIAHLGEDEAWRAEVMKDNRKIRSQPEKWQPGKFIQPHDACFDHDGNIFVAEYVATGRITKLKRIS